MKYFTLNTKCIYPILIRTVLKKSLCSQDKCRHKFHIYNNNIYISKVWSISYKYIDICNIQIYLRVTYAKNKKHIPRVLITFKFTKLTKFQKLGCGWLLYWDIYLQKTMPWQIIETTIHRRRQCIGRIPDWTLLIFIYVSWYRIV